LRFEYKQKIREDTWVFNMEKELTDLQKRVIQLKKERKALILAHNYQTLDIQQVADFVGDSLQLARKSAEPDGHELVIFAGVVFMAELASVLSNGVPVYIPAPKALCPLAAFVNADVIRKAKEEHPGVPVVVYVNTTAEAKSEADYICTSGSAVEVVESIGSDKVLFGPDANLADYVRRHTDVEIIDIAAKGHCYVHRQFDEAQITLLKEEHPDAIAIAHPECSIAVQDAADMVGSTGMMARFVAESEHKKFIIATEIGMIEQLQDRHPDKIILPADSGAACRQMKKNKLEQILDILENMPEENIVTVSESIKPHIRMLLERMNKVKGQGPAQSVSSEVHV
jgi:quinolinate synthase